MTGPVCIEIEDYTRCSLNNSWPWWFSRTHIRLVITRSWFDTCRVRQHFFVKTDRELFSSHSLSFTDSRAVVSFSQKNVHNYWLTT